MKPTARETYAWDRLYGGDGSIPLSLHVKRPRARALPKPRKCPTEEQEQTTLVSWWDASARLTGFDYRLLFAIPNAGRLGKNPDYNARKLAMIKAGKLKSQGLRKAFPDLGLAIPRPPYHGLFIELKAIDGDLGDGQDDYHAILRNSGYRVEVCYGADEAIAAIKGYLG